MKNPATQKALNSKFITGIHLAFLLDGWDYQETFSGLKYSNKTGRDWPKEIKVFIIFGDYLSKKQYETDAFVEIQYKGQTVIIWNVQEFEYFQMKQALIEFNYGSSGSSNDSSNNSR